SADPLIPLRPRRARRTVLPSRPRLTRRPRLTLLPRDPLRPLSAPLTGRPRLTLRDLHLLGRVLLRRLLRLLAHAPPALRVLVDLAGLAELRDRARLILPLLRNIDRRAIRLRPLRLRLLQDPVVLRREREQNGEARRHPEDDEDERGDAEAPPPHGTALDCLQPREAVPIIVGHHGASF